MNLSRRTFLSVIAAAPPLCADAIEFVDYHAHPEQGLPITEQVRLAAEQGVKLGIVEHAGMPRANNDHLVHNDQMLAEYIVMLRKYPVMRGIQAEGLDWPKAFSAAAVAKLDYVLSDALTFPEKDGRLVRLWRPGVTVGDKQDFMDRYTDFNIEVMAREPIDIVANPLFLPE
ncbi:MAG: hypothetical protein GY953_29850, partial [bacterium]|nr:hypothetical protein [bacterium]